MRTLVPVMLVLAGAAGIPEQRGTAPVTAARHQLLPTANLRVGLNAGNQLTRSVGREIGHDLARRLGVEAAFVDFPTPGAVAAAVGRDWDVAFIAADPEREAEIAFTPPYVELDAVLLVPAASPLQALADIDRPGVRIASGATSAYTLALRRDLRQATLVLRGGDAGLAALADGTVDAVAGLHFDLAARAAADPGVRVLPGVIARAQQAVAVPRAHRDALAYVSACLDELKQSGTIDALIRGTGLPGARVVP